jgi:uncharacterized delta-60 repeat protein
MFGITRATKTRRTSPRAEGRDSAHRPFEPLENRLLFVAGDFDPSFGSGGLARADFGDESLRAIDVAAAGSRVYAAGVYRDSDAPINSDGQLALAAFDSAGKLDNGFGGDGTVLTNIPALGGEMLVQPDGKIVVLTQRLSTAQDTLLTTVARFNANGTPDASFGGGDGRVELDFGSNIARAPDGKLVVSGFKTGGITVTRLNPNGTVDNTFDRDGRVVVNTGGADLAIQLDRKIVLVGSQQSDSIDTYASAVRLNENGSYDNSFDGDGLLLVHSGAVDNAFRAVSVGPGGEVVAGYAEGERNALPYVLVGSATLPANTRFAAVEADNPVPLDLHFGPGGKLVMSGSMGSFGLDDGPQSFAARYNLDGSLDPAFAQGTSIRPRSARTALAADGDVLAISSVDHFLPGGQVDVLRYTSSDSSTRNTVLQAEDAVHQRIGAVVARNHAGYTGSGFVDFTVDNGATQSFDFFAYNSGEHELRFRYANGGNTTRTLHLSLEDGPVRSIPVNFAPTGSWSTWREVTVKLTMQSDPSRTFAVRETVELRTIGQNGPNIDRLTVVRPATTVVPAPVTTQAEDATVVGAGRSSRHPGFTSTGYVDYNNASGDYIEWTVNSDVTRTGRLTVRYANGSSSNRPLELRRNGGVLVNLSFAPTGSWSTWVETTVNVPLTAGANTFRLTAIGQSGPNIDFMRVAFA